MEKIMRVGTMQPFGNRWASIYIKASLSDDGRFSISGVIGPLSNGNSLGGCGQIDMEFAHRDEKDNDKRYSNLIQPEEIRFAKGWNKEKWLDLLDVWKRWHLNDMRSACEHQRELGWTYEKHHNPKTFEGEACPVCGYKIGSSWLREEIPKNVIEFINALPDTDQQPPWV